MPLLIDSVQELDLVPDLCFANELLVDEDVSFVLVKKLIARPCTDKAVGELFGLQASFFFSDSTECRRGLRIFNA